LTDWCCSWSGYWINVYAEIHWPSQVCYPATISPTGTYSLCL